MITYMDIRPGDTFLRRAVNGSWELRRVMSDGSSDLVKRLDEQSVRLPERATHAA
jgi:hypothetical protein